MAFFLLCGFFLVSCAYGEFWSFWAPCYVQVLGYLCVPPAGHALWAEVGGGITFVTSGENTSKFKKTVYIFWDFWRIFDLEAVYACLSGTAQSPWL